MYSLTGEPLQTLYKIVAIFILLGVQLMATARARVRDVTVHMMAPNGPMTDPPIPPLNIPWYCVYTHAISVENINNIIRV